MPPDADLAMSTLLDSLDLPGRASRVVRRSLLVLGAFTLVLASALTAAGFFVTGLYAWLDSDLSPAEAAGVTGAVLLVLCGIVLLILVRLLGRAKRSAPAGNPAPHDTGRSPADLVDIASREAARNPTGAIVMALAAGVVYGLMNRPRRDS